MSISTLGTYLLKYEYERASYQGNQLRKISKSVQPRPPYFAMEGKTCTHREVDISCFGRYISPNLCLKMGVYVSKYV